MRVVLDASVAIKLATTEPDSYRAEPLVYCGLHAPDLLFAEITNTIWKKQARGDLTVELGQQALAALSSLRLTVTPSHDLMGMALELASASSHPAYDMFYVALAVRSGIPLITADTRLVGRIRALSPTPSWAYLITPLAEFQPG